MNHVLPWTGIVLAEALVRLGHEHLASLDLAGALSSDNPMVRLQAMDTIVRPVCSTRP